MNIKKAFTIVELVITITIMGILLGLAFVNLSSSQEKSRDEERQADVDAIAIHLETYYRSGSDTTSGGSYPSTTMMADESAIKSTLRDIEVKSLTSPDVESVSNTMKVATNATQSTTGVTPQPSASHYVYQPLAWSGSAWTLCTGSSECRRYNLYYRLESDNTVYVVESQHR